jgi:hypothetical protein
MMGMAGDPVFASKRRAAGSGTKAKAARHRAVRMRRMMGDPFISAGAMGQMSKAGLAKGPNVGAFLSNAAKGLGGFLSGLMPSKPADMAKYGAAAAQMGAGALASLQRRGAATSGFGGLPALPPGFSDPFAGVMGGGSATNKDGTPRRIRADGRPYKRPSLNALNPKALARAGRRFTGFKKAIKSVNASLPGGMKFEAPGARTSTKRRKR